MSIRSRRRRAEAIREPRRQVSGERQFAYYLGGLITIIGLLLFLSIFVSAIGSFDRGPMFGVTDHMRSMKSFAMRGFGGIMLMILGGAIRGLGHAGLAGSGVILDPEQAREDLEPFSRQAGGMLKDTLDEAGISLGGLAARGGESERVVMIKCRECGKLNEEDSKFCQECGEKM